MEKPSTARIALKWGFIAAIINIIFTVMIYMTGLFKTPSISWLGFLPLVFGIVMALREFKSSNNGFMTISEGLGVGTLMSAVAGLIGSIFSYIYINFIDTTIMQQMSDMQREQLEARGMTSEQVDQAMEMAAKFTSPGIMFLFGMIFFMIVGFIVSLIFSVIFKNNKPEMEF